MDESGKSTSTRMDSQRIILHFDYDYFYGAVVENQQPALKGLPLGIKQKSLLATCNYEARRLGVKKLMSISDAKKLCPELVLVSGEDLSPFRSVSKRLYSLIRSCSWNQKVERLGLDEVFFDATDIVDFNLTLLNKHDLAHSFFCISRSEPEKGFSFDARAVAGPVWGSASGAANPEDTASMRLLLASHFAQHMRMAIEHEGYTSVCGISTNKTLSKLAGTKNKPRNQTTLVPGPNMGVQEFMDSHSLREVPGIGSRILSILEKHIKVADSSFPMTVRLARQSANLTPQNLEQWLDSRTGKLVWDLLHGIDNAEVKMAADVPTQISIEDTYQGLDELSEIDGELRKLTAHLLDRMRRDLAEDDHWLACPRTLRLSTRPKTSPDEEKPYNFARKSRSQPLPGFVLSLTASIDELTDRLVQEAILPMFFHLNPGKRGWRIGMLNICLANMTLTGTEDGSGVGRNISKMFQKQEETLREWTVYDTDQRDVAFRTAEMLEQDQTWDEEMDAVSDEASSMEADAQEVCPLCGHYFPAFAAAAHERYHILENS